MKRIILYACVVLCVTMQFSCKPNYEATKAAYERAMSAAVEKPTITADIPTDDAITEIQPIIDHSKVSRERSESVKVLDNGTIDKYSVVVGTYKQKTNARGMRDRLIADGYNAVVAQNAQGMYRVIAYTCDNRAEAEKARLEIMNRYDRSYIGDPWMLVK